MNHGMELLDSGDIDLGLEHLSSVLIMDHRFRSDSQPALELLHSCLTPENFLKVVEHENRLTARLENSGEMENIIAFLAFQAFLF